MWLEGGWKAVGRLLEGGWKVVGRWLDGGWKVVGRWLEGGWKVVGRWLEGGCKVVGRWLEGGWKVVRRWQPTIPIAPQVPGTHKPPVRTIPYIAMVNHVLLCGINIRNVHILDQANVRCFWCC
jgi:hypothetical protein